MDALQRLRLAGLAIKREPQERTYGRRQEVCTSGLFVHGYERKLLQHGMRSHGENTGSRVSLRASRLQGKRRKRASLRKSQAIRWKKETLDVIRNLRRGFCDRNRRPNLCGLLDAHSGALDRGRRDHPTGHWNWDRR